MDFSSVPRSGLLGRVLRWPLRLLPPTQVVPILQGPLRGRRWIVGSATHGCWLGSYELAKQRVFTRLVVPGDVVYDVGAHVGFYTLLAAQCVGPRGQVVAFEPELRNLGYLRRHLELNRVTNVEVVEAAVAAASGWGNFRPGLSPSMGRLASAGATRVPTVALDVLVDEGLPAPGVVKMDIEGGEAEALLGARRVLTAHHPRLLVATHGREQHQACCALLAEIGYDLRSCDGRPVDRTDELFAVSRNPEGGSMLRTTSP
jgi:FkbM family methyltransferase